MPLLQNVDLLNNFFTASGKNNFYNQLHSIKTSPMYSPKLVDPEMTFAGFKNHEPDVESIKSWDLDDDEINEFDEVEETKNVKP